MRGTGYFSQYASSLEKLPVPPIQFGTDGWRALVAEDFTLPNVRAVAQAVATYLKRHPIPGRSRTLIVGYDTRPLGDRFAEAVAEVLAGNGFPVLLTQGPTPTPAVSLGIRDLRTSGGILITASHNPFTYNGLKFRPFYAGSAEPAITRGIERSLFRQEIRRIPYPEGIKDLRIRRVDLRPRYLEFLRGYVNWPALQKARFRVAYDPMHGSGQDLLQRALAGSRLKVLPLALNDQPVPSTFRPEPVAEQLASLSSFVRQHRCHVGLATDGDADRAGVVDPHGRFVSAQETMALLTWHLLEDRRWRGAVVTTVAGTNLMEAIAGHYRVALKRTPVGFKHITRLIRSTEVLLGGEESGGYGFKGCPPERDGILAGLLILEMMAMRGKSLSAILQDLRNRFGYWVFQRGDLTLSRPISSEELLGWARSLSGKLPGAKGLAPVWKIQTHDGVKVILKDRSWLLLRPSGTEPLLRIYAEARRMKDLGQLIHVGQTIGHRLMKSGRG